MIDYRTKNDINLNGSANFYYKAEIPYSAIPKHYLTNKKLSLKAKGLLTILYALPDKWDYSMKGLAKINNISIKSLRPIINELIETGYIDRQRKNDKKGRFYYEYCIQIEPYQIYPHLTTEGEVIEL